MHNCQNNNFNKKGFTLIELLVVISVIALLSTLALNAFSSARSKARDAKRISDLKALQTAMEMYKSEYNDVATTSTVELGKYIQGGFPKPTNGTDHRYCICAGKNTFSKQYLIVTVLENTPNPYPSIISPTMMNYSCKWIDSNLGETVETSAYNLQCGERNIYCIYGQ